MSAKSILGAGQERWHCPSVLALVAVVVGLSAVPAGAETLRGALAAAYRFNPEIEAQRASLRATDEEVPRAFSTVRPIVTATGDIGATRTRTSPGSAVTTNPRGVALTVQQEVFRGFRTLNQLRNAEATIRAGRAILHTTEQSVLQQAVTAYMNVVQNQAIVRLQESNVRVLSQNLRATQDRFAAGEVTKTDVAQSRARRAGAVSDLDLARANLKTARANFQRLIGHAPNRLRGANVPERLVPNTLSIARTRARNEAPSVVTALFQEQAARHNVSLVWGELLPTVAINGNLSRRFDDSAAIDSTSVASIVGTLTIPLYVGGEVRARLRQAKHLHVQSIQLVAQARVLARETVVSAWAALRASRAQLRSDRAQVEANRVALSGVREEEKVGQRTLLDVLDAEQELLDAQVQLVTTQRNLVVNAYALIAATGRLTAQELGLSKRLYDPEAHYFDVRKKWFGISITHSNGRHERLNVWHSHGKKTLK